MTRAHRRAHRAIWLLLAGLLPVILLASMALRPIGPDEAPQIRLVAPK